MVRDLLELDARRALWFADALAAECAVARTRNDTTTRASAVLNVKDLGGARGDERVGLGAEERPRGVERDARQQAVPGRGHGAPLGVRLARALDRVRLEHDGLAGRKLGDKDVALDGADVVGEAGEHLLLRAVRLPGQLVSVHLGIPAVDVALAL